MKPSKDPLISTLSSFLNAHLLPGDKFLIAFSGGPDSLALLHLLLHSKPHTLHAYELALAHVDHGWRPESKQEVEEIRRIAHQNHLQLHLKTLNPAEMKGNLEAACREERYRFFKELCAKHGYKGVFLGHHADDLAETVLKRLFEGVSIVNLTGMQPVGHVEGVQVLRPLLTIKKKQILAWLKKKGLQGFNDSTNLDPKFMRGRLRTEIIPQLSDYFGKEIASGLCSIAEEAREVKGYLDKVTDLKMPECYPTVGGGVINFSKNYPSDRIEVKHLLKRIFKMEGVLVSRDALNLIIDHLENNSSKKYVAAGIKKILINKKRIFIEGVEGE